MRDIVTKKRGLLLAGRKPRISPRNDLHDYLLEKITVIWNQYVVLSLIYIEKKMHINIFAMCEWTQYYSPVFNKIAP